MLHVAPLTDLDEEEFCSAFKAYYEELDCEDDGAHIAREYVIPDLLAGLLYADVLRDNGVFAGFIVYQRDDIDNDWNLKEGWGDVREIYVIPSLRRSGLGKFMLYSAEMKLRERDVKKAYCLPNEISEGFFAACGYVKTNEFHEDTECFLFVKTNLENGDCKK